MCVCVRACVRACVRVCVYVCVCVRARLLALCMYLCVCVSVRVCVSASVRECERAYMRVSVSLFLSHIPQSTTTFWSFWFRILVLEDGTVREFDTPQNLLLRPDSTFAAMLKDAGFA